METAEDATSVQDQARELYRQSVMAEMPMTGRQLGERFGRSERWGRDRKNEVDRAAGAALPPDVPPTDGSATAEDAAERTGEIPLPAAVGSATRQPEDDAATETAVAATETAAGGERRQPERQEAEDPKPEAAVVAAPHARFWAWSGFLFGTVISVAANVLHAWLPVIDPSAGTSLPEGWTPGIAPQVGAAVWPIALLISVEVLSRAPWPTGWAWQLARYGGAGVVAAGAAIISYGHLHDLLEAWEYTAAGALVGPLVVDGLMVISGFALLASSGSRNGASGKPE